MGEKCVLNIHVRLNKIFIYSIFWYLWFLLLLSSESLSTSWFYNSQSDYQFNNNGTGLTAGPVLPYTASKAKSHVLERDRDRDRDRIHRKFVLQNQEKVMSVCDMFECNCTSVLTTKWISVKCDFDNKNVNFKPTSFPNNTQEIIINGGNDIELPAKLFINLQDLQMISFTRIYKLKLRKHSFLNLTTNNLFLNIVECIYVLIEEDTFKNIGGTLTAAIKNSNALTIESEAFSYLSLMEIENVVQLELSTKAFKFYYPTNRRLSEHGAESVIRLTNVHIPELAQKVFSTITAAIKIKDSSIRVIRKNAFATIAIYNLTFQNTSIGEIETTAFTDSLEFLRVDILDSTIEKIKTNGILSAIETLTIARSKIAEIDESAVRTISGHVIIENTTFGLINSNGFMIRQTSSCKIRSNKFRTLAANSFNITMVPSNTIFHFISNEIYRLTTSSLEFLVHLAEGAASGGSGDDTEFQMEYLKFPEHLCKCDSANKWLSDIFGTQENLYVYEEISYCSINSLLSACYSVKQGLLNMKDFKNLICVNNTNRIDCPQQTATSSSKNNGAKTVIETINKELTTRFYHSGDSSENNNSYLYLVLALSVVFLIVILGAFVMLLIKGGLWLKRKGYCVQFSRFQQYNSTHHNHHDLTTETEDMIITPDQTITENKLNENLPTELTHDLLQMLREKLNDPDSYNEAREMIERLYDHFLIEEPYTNTEDLTPGDDGAEGTHLYEELNSRGLTSSPTLPVGASSPTSLAASSPLKESVNALEMPAYNFLRIMEERLNEPSTSTRPMLMMGEYAEPMDAAETSRNPKEKETHVYSELPVVHTKPQSSMNGGAIAKMALRPLPSKPSSARTGHSEASSSKVFGNISGAGVHKKH